MTECIMLERCYNATGIDCHGRAYDNCDFLKHLQREQRPKPAKPRRRW